MLNVFITVDTELWPFSRDWRERRLSAEMARDIYGRTRRGEHGVRYQTEVLNRHGLKAVFFVEALVASAIGPEPLGEIVRLVQDAGHEVQLHVHTEWLDKMERPLLGERRGYNIHEFSEDEQATLIGTALENLRAAGARDVCAYRAGNYGAGFTTLRALAKHGIRFDSSYNPAWLDRDCQLRTPSTLTDPVELEGVCELPIAAFLCAPRRSLRHAQLCACSSLELEGALLDATRRDRRAFVLVSHSFELITQRERDRPGLADRVVLRRFERLCRFLAAHRATMVTRGFAGLDPADVLPARPDAALWSAPPHATAWRHVEQLARRIAP